MKDGGVGKFLKEKVAAKELHKKEVNNIPTKARKCATKQVLHARLAKVVDPKEGKQSNWDVGSS